MDKGAFVLQCRYIMKRTRSLVLILDRVPDFAFAHALTREFPKCGVYLVGGCVRDAMLKMPIKDFDFMVTGVPMKALAAFLAQRGKIDLVGKRFGVLKFRPSGTADIYDIALPRTERAGMSGGYRDFSVQSDPNLPLKSDLARRDFTVNAMAWDVRDGKLLDPFGGEKDLRRKIIRAVGVPEARFREDHSRMLRALRFAVVLGFKIEPKTWKALVRSIRRVNDEVAGERTVPYEVAAREFMKAFSVDPVRTLKLWRESGALSALLPELVAVKVKQTGAFVNHRAASPAVALASMLSPLGARTAEAVVERLKFASIEGMRITPRRVRRLVAGGTAAILKDEGVKPLISAGEIMRHLKLEAGPEVGRTLDKVLEAQAKGIIRTKSQAVKFLSSRAKR